MKVMCYDFLFQEFSILNDPALMHADNVVFGDNPFKRFSRKDYHGDTHTSEWYIMTQLLECIDKTHAKGNGSKPISFTLGIYRRHIQITPKAWRHIGFIPGKMGKLIPLVEYANKDAPLFCAGDYHQVVGAIKTQKELPGGSGMRKLTYCFGPCLLPGIWKDMQS